MALALVEADGTLVCWQDAEDTPPPWVVGQGQRVLRGVPLSEATHNTLVAEHTRDGKIGYVRIDSATKRPVGAQRDPAAHERQRRDDDAVLTKARAGVAALLPPERDALLGALLRRVAPDEDGSPAAGRRARP